MLAGTALVSVVTLAGSGCGTGPTPQGNPVTLRDVLIAVHDTYDHETTDPAGVTSTHVLRVDHATGRIWCAEFEDLFRRDIDGPAISRRHSGACWNVTRDQHGEVLLSPHPATAT